jgi:hypothetical protein
MEEHFRALERTCESQGREIARLNKLVKWQTKNFRHVIKWRDTAMNALRDIRDGKDNPSYLSREVVGETQCRGVGNGIKP